MSAYWFMFSIPILMSILPIKFTSPSNYKLLLAYAFICVLFIGFRFEVGGDWMGYVKIANIAYVMDFFDFIVPNESIYGGNYNPGFLIITWISQHLGLDILGANLFCAAIFMFGLNKFCKTQPYPWVGYVVAFPYLIAVVAMGYTRQSLTIGIALWCFVIWQKDEKYCEIKIIILALIGAMFHKSLLFILLLIIIRNKGKIIDYKNVLLVAPLVLLLLVLLPVIIETVVGYSIQESIVSRGAFIRLLMNVPPCLLLIYFYKNFKEFNDRRLWTISAFVAIILPFLVSYASTLFDRMGLYLISLQIVVYSRIPLFINDFRLRTAFIISLCTVYIAVLFVWLNYSNSSWAWIPYKINLLQITFPIAYYYGPPLIVPSMDQF